MDKATFLYLRHWPFYLLAFYSMGTIQMNEAFGIRLRRYRKAKKLSQQNLADLVGISRASIANYEAGSARPSFEVVIKITEFLDFPIKGIEIVEINREEISRRKKNRIEEQIKTCENKLAKLRTRLLLIESTASDEASDKGE